MMTVGKPLAFSLKIFRLGSIFFFCALDHGSKAKVTKKTLKT